MKQEQKTKFKTGDLIRNVNEAHREGENTWLKFITRYGDLAIVLGESEKLRGVQIGAPSLTVKIHHQRRNEIFDTHTGWWEIVE